MDHWKNLLRNLPSVERVVAELESRGILQKYPRWLVVEASRQAIGDLREAIQMGRRSQPVKTEEVTAIVEGNLSRLERQALRKVINATGVIIHTNLGRAILCEPARRAIEEVTSSYSNLELDLESGRRTSRTRYVEKLVEKIVGSEAAFIVNNNAAAVLLVLNTLCKGREVIVSRGELIEIGGSFRLPEIMEASGARLVEVGTTNRTRLSDYENHISDRTSAILKVHRSNFEMYGFVESPELSELISLARKYEVLIIEDLGSGALYDFSRLGLAKEPLAQESIRAGVDIVTFSADKLLGGPQAGILAGKGDLIDRMKRNPIARTIRVDRMTLAGLQATLEIYLEADDIEQKIPTLQMISQDVDRLRMRADKILASLKDSIPAEIAIERIEERGRIGGGSLPGAEITTIAISISSSKISAGSIAKKLRQCPVPIIPRISLDRVLIDLRTVRPSEDALLSEQLKAVLAEVVNA